MPVGTIKDARLDQFLKIYSKVHVWKKKHFSKHDDYVKKFH